MAIDRLQARWAVEGIYCDPVRSVSYAIRKLWIAASGQFSPARSLVVQVSYALLFVPVHLLALVGLWRSRGDPRIHTLPLAIFISFMVTTAIFWAHTSHKSYLDAFLFVYVAAALHSMRSFSSPLSHGGAHALAG